MSINIDKLIKLNDLITTSFRRKHIIVLNPEEEYENKENLIANIIFDKVEWKIPEEIRIFVDEVSHNDQLSNEDKILLIYEKLCKDYVYDDNILSYIQKSDDDSYDLPDRYGREIDEEWEKNREEHNRRVCYEVSRYLAESLKELFKDNEEFNVCILWDKSLTHYFVGLTCNDYSITLDLDDFNNIKDLTRLKTGLTAEGMMILEDKEDKFKSVLDKFNESRIKDAVEKIENEIDNDTNISNPNIEDQNSNLVGESDDIVFLKNAIEILKEKYDIDSQGLYEYIKEIVDIKLGPESRKKVWKEIKGKNLDETRYIRCLLLDVENQKYIIDVDQRILRTFDEEELKKEDRNFIPYKELLSEDVSNYRRHQLYNGLYNGR